jgi:hypothetical protein
MQTEQKEYKQYYTTQADQQSAHQTFVRYLRHKYLSGGLVNFVVVSKLRCDPAYNLWPAEYVYSAKYETVGRHCVLPPVKRTRKIG